MDKSGSGAPFAGMNYQSQNNFGLLYRGGVP